MEWYVVSGYSFEVTQPLSVEVYISSKGYIHRDLAARSVLLTSDMVAKIADFGLCYRPNEESCLPRKPTRLPVKWTAPEALAHDQFGTESDV